MALPSVLQRLYSFTGFQQAQGDDSFPGTQIDVEFDQTNDAIDAILAQLNLLVRADGKFANGSVTRNALAGDILLGLGASRPWSAGAAYAQNDTVTRGYGLYVALASSTGADPATSPAAWALQADLSQAVVIAPGSIDASAFPNAGIPESKLAAGAASNRVIAAGAVDRSKAARNLGIMPVGAETDYAGFALPAGWLFCAGQAVSRTAYADLFSALTMTFVGNVAIGNPGIGVVDGSDYSGLGLRGATVEGPGIPAGTTVTAVSAGFVSLSAVPTSTNNNVVYRLLPFGQGNGATTFNVPDRRGRVVAGRDDMGGVAAGRLVLPFDGSNLSSAGGALGVTLTNANLPVTLPNGNVLVGYPTITYPTFVDFVGASQGAGGTTINGLWHNSQAATFTQPSTNFGTTTSNPGGGNAFAIVQPTGVANRIIFAGVCSVPQRAEEEAYG